MARKFFTSLPDKYFMKLTRKGHRNEVLFTLLGIGFVHYYVFSPIYCNLSQKNVELKSDWKPSIVNGSQFYIKP